MSSSQFISILDRNISPEFFLNALLSDEDLSYLLCTCRAMKKMILKWKNILPIKEVVIKNSMTDKMVGNMIMHYSSNIEELVIPHYKIPLLLTIDGYHHLALLHSNLLNLCINDCLGNGLFIVSSSFVNLTTLLISNSPSVLSEDLDSLSKLTNLEKINLISINHLDDAAVVNYSTLSKIRLIRLLWSNTISGLGLSDLVANKQFLVAIEIAHCNGISSEGYHCLTTLTNLTNLTVYYCKLDDIVLNMICSSCLLIEYLEIMDIEITIEGWNSVHCLIHLKTLLLSGAKDDWLAKLSHNTALTRLDLWDSKISEAGLSHLSCSRSKVTCRWEGSTTMIEILRLD
jgi:hypothetical protein